MKIAYFVNCYPQASHSFIRREIVALESLGLSIQRISIRPPQQVIDPADVAERDKTFVLLGSFTNACALAISWMLRHPLGTMRGLQNAMQIGYRSGEPMKHLLYCLEGLALAAWLRRQRISHIHAHFGTNPASVVMYCKLAGGANYSVTIHGSEEFDAPERLVLRDKIYHAVFIAAVSQFCRSQIFRWCTLADWEKVHIVHCGVDDEFLRRQPTPVPDTPRLVCVGRLCEQKGQLLLVRAAAQIIESGIPFQLVLVGDGPMRAEVEELIRQHHLEQHIQITGWQSTAVVRQHIQDSRAMVLPSFAEGVPVVIMEALALYRPVISTYVGGIPELVQPGISGWLTAPSDIDALLEAMHEALLAPAEKLHAMGLAGNTKVRQNHDSLTEARIMANCFATFVNQNVSRTDVANQSVFNVVPRAEHSQ